MFTCPFDSLHSVASTVWDMTTVSKMGPTIAVVLPRARVLRQKPTVGSALPRANKVRDKETQRVASSWHTRDPIEGAQHPQDLYLSPDWEVSFTPHCVGLHLVVRVFPIGIPWEHCLKPPSLN
jgi:hypothetical protein